MTLLPPHQYRQEIEAELTAILAFWMTHSPDQERGGFIGRLTGNGHLDPEAPKGAVLNARILWTFSAAARQTNNPAYRAVADRAYAYFSRHFIDLEFGGVYWSVDPAGKPLSPRKQIYALGFAIYGLSEYHQLTGEPAALDLAKSLYQWIETHSYDPAQGGYFEAFSQEGALLSDLRLSAKDRNDPKTMNTHLHILEGYTNLYRIWPDAGLANQIRALLGTFQTHLIDSETSHLRLFFTADWHSTAALVSYGHDIEAAWLLLEAAEVLHDGKLMATFSQLAVAMARATAAALQADGSLYHEYNIDTNHYDTHREWWVSAEAMVGFLNAWQLSGNETFYNQSVQSWQFIQRHLLDREGGEWRWGVFDTYQPMTADDKIGFWKCPYHNVRACLEVISRLEKRQVSFGT
ncbi:AGE family epimerase/isomerase [Fibrivirga algicola]|uniref:Cellobiose 2-epimerase n=1 Tax=Fibrivirga algicola TaxID=2950420 RepID=A0ABX0QNI1_9BACT|nr:AGE family epimerase/isomerase [Fibrivirga algicola]NID12343.1 N-acyl-D-glucosamine 2-epimerase [Fibrivirga algicola]